VLEKGPNLIELVSSSLNRFREREIGVISDIKKVFLQIVINKDYRDNLRFLWIMNGEIVILRHCRVVFGLACSPFLLAAIIELHLSTFRENTKSIEKLKQAFYVDNCVTSMDSKGELKTFRTETILIMSQGGFELRGWKSSNDATENRETLVLGILWNKEKDSPSINPTVVKPKNPNIITKREILSAAQKMFDPIGFTCPTSLLPKLLLKELWTEKIDWDTKVADNQANRFVNWLKDLPVLNKIEIPRKLGKGDLTLHVFSDASGTAYAAVVFARVEYEKTVKITLLSARSRLAPEKATIPRLELMAATIATRLTDSIIKSLTRKISKITYWTDSTTVLAWIKRDIQWGTFVWNRIKEIRMLSKPEEWRYIPGESNPRTFRHEAAILRN